MALRTDTDASVELSGAKLISDVYVKIRIAQIWVISELQGKINFVEFQCDNYSQSKIPGFGLIPYWLWLKGRTSGTYTLSIVLNTKNIIP